MSEIDATVSQVPAPATPARRPDGPSKGPLDWAITNLFSSVSSTVQTVLFAGVLVLILWWLTGQIFSHEVKWSSVWTNMRLLMAYNYPQDQLFRVWVSLGTLVTAAGLSLGAWRATPNLTLGRVGQLLLGFAGLMAAVFVLSPADGDAKQIMAIIAVVAGAAGAGAVLSGRGVGPTPLQPLVVFGGIAALVLALVWLVPFGRFLFVDGAPVYQSGTLSSSTKEPVTIIVALFLGAYVVASAVGQTRRLRLALVAFWLIGPAFLIFGVLRKPTFDWAHVVSTDIPMALGFILVGGALLYWLADPARFDLARAVGAALLLLALFHFLAGGLGLYPMLQKARLSFLLLALFTLAVPTFGGDESARRRLATAWAGVMVLLHLLITIINTASTLEVAGPFLGGFVLTVSLAYYVMLASFPLGLLMALARTSKMPIFRVLSTSYIEFVRGIPLITVLFFFSIMVPLFLPPGMSLSKLGAFFVGYTLFSAAYMAENIRGGLQSIRQGQFEASDALGLTTAQRTIFIILPQALRVSIPNLVGQAIATFKETSLVAIAGGFELLRVADKTISNQSDFLGQKKAPLLFASFVYWIFAYAMSRTSRNLETKLGVGSR